MQKDTDFTPPYNLLDSYQAGTLTPEAQIFFLERYPLLAKLKASPHLRLNTSRYDHTIRLLNSFYQVIEDDYQSFRHLDPQAQAKGLHPLTQSQFNHLRNLLLANTASSEDRHYLFLLLLTHDYGAIYGNSRHFIKSGELCPTDFLADGFSSDQARLSGLLNGNHSYLGDLFLGEGTVTYGLDLLQSVEKSPMNPTQFWERLFLLNALDIHSTLSGFLSREKYHYLQEVQQADNLKALEHQWAAVRFKHLIEDDAFYPRFKDVLPEQTAQIYFQYVWYLAHQLSQTELTTLFKQCAQLLVLSQHKQLHPIKFFTFSGDSPQHLAGMRQLCSGDNLRVGTPEQGSLNQIPFAITPDGYLEFFIHPESR